MNLQTLKSELIDDPQSLGYTGDDVRDAELLNVANRPTVDTTTIDGGTLVASIVRSEFAALSASDKQFVQLVSMANVLPITATLRAELGAVFGQGTKTRANLLSLLKRVGSRGEELGLGHVTPSDVANARRLI